MLGRAASTRFAITFSRPWSIQRLFGKAEYGSRAWFSG
jgi:hypothetical protein